MFKERSNIAFLIGMICIWRSTNLVHAWVIFQCLLLKLCLKKFPCSPHPYVFIFFAKNVSFCFFFTDKSIKTSPHTTLKQLFLSFHSDVRHFIFWLGMREAIYNSKTVPLEFQNCSKDYNSHSDNRYQICLHLLPPNSDVCDYLKVCFFY